MKDCFYSSPVPIKMLASSNLNILLKSAEIIKLSLKERAA